MANDLGELRLPSSEELVSDLRGSWASTNKVANLQQQTQSQAPTSVSALIRAEDHRHNFGTVGHTSGNGTADIWTRAGPLSVIGDRRHGYNQYNSSSHRGNASGRVTTGWR